MMLSAVDPRVYHALETGDFGAFAGFSASEIRPILPSLVRTSLCPSEAGRLSEENRQQIMVALAELDSVNFIVSLLSVDFAALESDVKKELQLRQKLGHREQDSILVKSLPNGLSVEFERSEATRKLRLVLSEVLFVMSQIPEQKPSADSFYFKSSDLFDNWVYLDDLSDCISTVLVELPNLISITDVCEALLHVSHGPLIITRIVANNPDLFVEVCIHLITNGEKSEEDHEGGLIRLKALRSLCKMNPHYSTLIISRCVEMKRMPALAVYLTLYNGPVETNLIPFLSGLLLGNDHATRIWFSSYIRNAQKRKLDAQLSLTKLRVALWGFVGRIRAESSGGQLSDNNVILASAFLRLACALRGIAGFKFNDTEITELVSLLTLRFPTTLAGYRFVTLALCTIIACPSLLATLDQEKAITEWIRSLLKEDYKTNYRSGGNSSFGEILLLIAIHFHSNQLQAISDLVSNTLSMKIPIRVNSMSKIKLIFIQDVFPENVVASHSIKVAVTEELSADISGYLPIHCIYQLLKSRAFTKHRVPIKDWIYRQILQAKFPIHPVFPALLEVYAQSILYIPSGQQLGKVGQTDVLNEPLSDEEVLRVFKSFELQDLVPQLLILYYLLVYEDFRLSNCRSLSKTTKSYSSRLFAQIPIKLLLQEAQKQQTICGGLFPFLLKLLTTHFPQLSILNEWQECVALPQVLMKEKVDLDLPTQLFQSAFANCNERPVDAINLLETCKCLPPYKLWSYSKNIIDQIKVVAQPEMPRKVQDLYREVWYLLNNVFPRQLWELTANAMMPSGTLGLTLDEITLDPLQMLRVDMNVFRSPPILNILLHILSASLAASRYFLAKHLQENPIDQAQISITEIEREEMKNALVAIQESSAVQILLETCLPSNLDDNDIASDLCLKEVQSVICSFLHQMFITDPNLAKLVHFQGYPLDLLPITISGIPSMHICLDFIPELLNQPEMDKKIFAIQLASYLSIQYSLPKSFDIARLALTTLISMTSGVDSEERASFFIPVLSSLCRFSKAFPPLIEDSVTLLLNLGRICKAQNSIERNRMNQVVRNSELLLKVNETYKNIVGNCLNGRKYF